MQAVIIKIVVAIVAVIIIAKYISPLLVGFFPPFGLIIAILLYIGVLYYVLGGYVFP